MTKRRQRAYQWGLESENLAALILQSKGYSVVERRYKTFAGEIDLIVRKADMLAFVEVKARQTLDEALFSLSEKSRKRIENAALVFVSEHPEFSEYGMRFDLLAIESPFRWKHLDNAWRPDS